MNVERNAIDAVNGAMRRKSAWEIAKGSHAIILEEIALTMKDWWLSLIHI